jgi:hypothetical protein
MGELLVGVGVVLGVSFEDGVAANSGKNRIGRNIRE